MNDKEIIEYLQDIFEISYQAFESSRREHEQVRSFYHNKPFSDEQLQKISRAGVAPETHNLVKMFTRMLVGYYSTEVNTIKVIPQTPDDSKTSAVINDLLKIILTQNNFDFLGNLLKIDCMISGLMCLHIQVVQTEETDQFGRFINEIKLSHVRSDEVLLDPMSRNHNYSDARYIHRFKWVSEEHLRAMLLQSYGKKKTEEIIKKLPEYSTDTGHGDLDFNTRFKQRFGGRHDQYNAYFLVHSVYKDKDGNNQSVFWSNDIIISKEKLPFNELDSPYIVQKLHDVDKPEFYGVFREILPLNLNINLSINKIMRLHDQLKVLYETGAIKDGEEDKFLASINRMGAAVEVDQMEKVQFIQTHADIEQLYKSIEHAKIRAREILGINNSFLGQAHASDSGRKVQLQRGATILQLRYLTDAIGTFYYSLGTALLSILPQYKTAHEIFGTQNPASGQSNFVEINVPMTMPKENEGGYISEETHFEDVYDSNGNFLLDEKGGRMQSPIPTPETDIQSFSGSVIVESSSYDDGNERNQVMLEQILQGTAGQWINENAPHRYGAALALLIKASRTKDSQELAELFQKTADEIEQQPPELKAVAAMGGNLDKGALTAPGAQDAKLPQYNNGYPI